jgi:hypothetical protein
MLPSATMIWWAWRRTTAVPPIPIRAATFLRATGLERTYRSLDAGGCHLIFLDPVEPTGDALRYRGNHWTRAAPMAA